MEASAKRRCLALWFPYLACERVQRSYRQRALTPPEPLVLTHKVKGALRLVAVDAAAVQLGLHAGLALADARARVPGLAAGPHDPPGDALFLQQLAARLSAFTPMVALDEPDGLVLDMTGCLHLFADECALVRGLRAATGLTARHAFAGNAAAARALARYGEGAESDVRQLPVAALELDAAATKGLRCAGLTRIGDLAIRPMAALAARFGEAAVMRLRQVLGDADAPITPHRAMPPLHFERRFGEPIARTDDALKALEGLLGEAATQLEERQAGGRRFTATLNRSDGTERALTVETALPVRDPAAVMRFRLA